ncbi:MAG: metal-sensing transcriptional repressor [Candidatus Gastranaerophilales bacterium]|nr:metal-sensing transcriptional repressor [Candidatus Gastranaerophilales bacterium]
MENTADGTCCGGSTTRTKQRSEKEHKDLINRLSRIEGQIRGIRGMVERDAYCTDILTQVSAVTSALNSFNRVLLEAHMKTCVTRDIKEGREESLEELLEILRKMIR